MSELKRSFGLVAYILCLAFVFSGAFNYGFSRFWLALPFMSMAVFLSQVLFKKPFYIIITRAYCALCVGVNYTLEWNPLVFPILSDGYITITDDGYATSFSDGSGMVDTVPHNDLLCSTCGPVTSNHVYKGQRYKVLGLKVNGGIDAPYSINLLTELGGFTVHPGRDELNFKFISTNKPADSRFFSNVGILMYYPIIPIILMGRQ